MSRVYLLVYSRELGTRTQLKTCLSKLPEVITWRSELPNSFFLQSDADARTIATAITECIGSETPRFIIAEIQNDSAWGWLVQESWDFIKQKQKSNLSRTG